MPSSPAGGSGRESSQVANRVTPRAPAPAVAAVSPVDSCQRAHVLGQVLQPGLGDPGEPYGGVAPGDADNAEPPGIARVLRFPAGTEREGLDAAPRVEDERAPAVPASPHRTGGPPFLRPVQQGRRARSGQHGRERPDVRRRQPGVLLVAAALQDVLYFQAEPGGQPPQVDMFLTRAGVLPGGGELVRVGAAVSCPPFVVATAEHGRGLGPQAAVADPAGCRRLAAAPAQSAPASQPGPGGPRGATAWRAGCTAPRAAAP